MTETTGAEVGEGKCPCRPCRERALKKRIRAVRWITRHSDLTTPPIPTLRWTLLLILGLCCWAAGIPLDFRDWLGPIIIAGALILPDAAGFGVAGFRLDLKQAQDDLATLRQDVNAQARSTSTAILAIGNDGIGAVQTLAQASAKLNKDQASGPAARWEGSPGIDSPERQDIP